MAKHASDKRILSVLVSVEDLGEIDRLAAKIELTRSELVRNIIDVGLDQVKMLDSTGALSAVGTFRRLMASLKENQTDSNHEKTA